MANVKVARYDDFTGGLNLRADQFQLAKNESPDMKNVEIDPRGGVFSRGAMRRINETAIGGVWTPLASYPFYGATSNLMVSTATEVLHSTGGNFVTLDSAASTPLVVTSEYGASFASWGAKLYMSLGYASLGWKWETGNAYATSLLASGPTWQDDYAAPVGGYRPKANLTCVHANKMFVADTTEDGVRHPTRIRYSHEANPEDWASADYLDINSGGTRIKSINTVNGQLVIFKDEGIFVLLGYDADTFQLVEATGVIGVHSPRQVATMEGGVYFFGHPHGLYFFDGSQITYVSSNLKPLFDLKQLNEEHEDDITVSILGHRVWLSVPYDIDAVANVPTVSFVYDPSLSENGSFTMFQTSDGYGVISGCDWLPDSGESVRIMLHPISAYALNVDMYGQYYDLIVGDQAGFPSYYRTPFVDGGSYAMKKMFRRPDFVFKEVNNLTAIVVKVFHNYEESLGNERKTFLVTLQDSSRGMRWDTGNWGENWGVVGTGSKVAKGSNLGLARAAQLLLTGPTGAPWGMNSVTYKFNTRKVTG